MQGEARDMGVVVEGRRDRGRERGGGREREVEGEREEGRPYSSLLLS